MEKSEFNSVLDWNEIRTSKRYIDQLAERSAKNRLKMSKLKVPPHLKFNTNQLCLHDIA